MEEQVRDASAPRTENRASPAVGDGWADLRRLAILVLLVVALRAWQITHTEVASRDSICYIRIAWHLQRGNWREVIPHAPQHPGYSLAVLGMSLPVRHFIPNDLPRAWQLSAQLTSALASVLLLVPMFYLGRELFDRRVAFWACVLFQCLPTSGKVMGDGLSDTLFLLCTCTGLWLACVALRRGSWIVFALTGLASGLAYLTRPEGALVVGVTGLVLLGVQLNPAWRRSWKSVLGNGVALSLAALALMTPYMLLIGGVTVKNTPNIMMHSEREDADWEGRLRPQVAEEGRATIAWNNGWLNAVGHLVDAQRSAKSQSVLPLFVGAQGARRGTEQGVLLRDVDAGAAGSVVVPRSLPARARRLGAAAGLPSPRRPALPRRREDGLSVRPPFARGHSVQLFLGRRCGRTARREAGVGSGTSAPALAGSRWTDGRVWSMGLLLLLSIAPLPRTLQSLHAERAGFRPVGRWLAENTCPGDFIEDPYCWTYYWAGRVFVEGLTSLPAQQPPCYYVVLEESKNEHVHLVSLRQALLDVLRQKGSTVVHEQAVRRGKSDVKILVWRVPGAYGWTPLPALPGQNK